MIKYPEIPLGVIKTSPYRRKVLQTLSLMRDKFEDTQDILNMLNSVSWDKDYHDEDNNIKTRQNERFTDIIKSTDDVINNTIAKIIAHDKGIKYILDQNEAIPPNTKYLITGLHLKEQYLINIRRVGMFTGEISKHNPKNIQMANKFNHIINDLQPENLYLWCQDNDEYELATFWDVLNCLDNSIDELKKD